MSWPARKTTTRRIQSPELCFADPELNDAKPACDRRGVPVPRSGGFAAVYQLRSSLRHAWAVKCFTKSAPGREDRYAAVHRYLPGLKLPVSHQVPVPGDGNLGQRALVSHSQNGLGRWPSPPRFYAERTR